jgi:cytochrome c553
MPSVSRGKGLAPAQTQRENAADETDKPSDEKRKTHAHCLSCHHPEARLRKLGIIPSLRAGPGRDINARRLPAMALQRELVLPPRVARL